MSVYKIPLVSRVFILFSLVLLVILSSIGFLMIVGKTTGFFTQVWFLRPVHSQLMWLSWVLCFVIGTAWWIMPKRPDLPNKFGQTAWAWLSFICLFVFSFVQFLVPFFQVSDFFNWLPLVGMLSFVRGIWPRLKPMIHTHEP